MKFLKMMILLGVVTTFFSNESKAQAGGSAVPFLIISPDARASGMGETGVAIADDINAVFWNPGGLGFLDYFKKANEYDDGGNVNYRQVALSFSPWLPQFNADLFYSYGTYAQRVDAIDGTIAVNFTFMNLGEFQQTYDNGQPGIKFNSDEFALGVTYGTIIAPDLGFGFQLKYIRSKLTPSDLQNNAAGSGVSIAFDLGVLWKPQNLDVFGLDLENNLSLGLNLQNVGPKMTYVKEADPLPTNLKLGAAYKVYSDEFSEIKFAVDMNKLLVKRDQFGSDPLPKSLATAWNNPGAAWSLGMEYEYQKMVALRAGYFTEPAQLGNRQYWNFGAGIKYEIFKLNFSFINTVESNHPLANTMRFSMVIDWQ
jgi:hypothetical protein